MSYNGHKNWAHWNVALWIGNDYGLYMRAKNLITAMGKDKAAEAMAESLAGEGDTHTPDGARYSKTAIRAALRGL